MAKPARKITTRKPATTPKAAEAPRTTASASTGKSTAAAGNGTATIKIDKEKHGGTVRGGVNGVRYEFAVGVDVPNVTADQLNSLRDSHVEFEIVSPLAGEAADEGSSAASTLHNTATRLEPAAGAPEAEGGAAAPAESHELRQIPDADLKTASQREGAAAAGEAGEGKDEAKG